MRCITVLSGLWRSLTQFAQITAALFSAHSDSLVSASHHPELVQIDGDSARKRGITVLLNPWSFSVRL
jgi:hypothetical protein